MKKTLIILGVLLILIAGGVWAYLFIFGAPSSPKDVFSDFGVGGEPTFTEQPSIVDTSPVDEGGVKQSLRQLTTRPTIGAVFTGNGIRYVERGTGHIYDIVFSNGNESLISGTTIPHSTEAVFSQDGGRVAITSDDNGVRQTMFGSLAQNSSGEGGLEGKALPPGSREVSFDETGERVLYILSNAAGASGYAYDTTKDKSVELFSVPLRDVRVLWGSPLYIYTTPSAKQIGALYEVATNTLKYVTSSGYALTGTRYGGGLVVSRLRDSMIDSRRADSTAELGLPIAIIPEKCVANPIATTSLICAAPLGDISTDFPDVWYQGSISHADYLFKVNVVTGEAALLSDLLSESGREIDVSQIGMSRDGKYVYFINKNDDSLWMYDLSL